MNTVALPCMQVYVVSMVGIREDAAVVCSARGVLGAEAEPFLEKQPVLLRHGDVAIILMFDVVQDVIECPDDQIHHLQEVAQTGLLRLQRLYMPEGKPMSLISPPAIVRAIPAYFTLSCKGPLRPQQTPAAGALRVPSASPLVRRPFILTSYIKGRRLSTSPALFNSSPSLSRGQSPASINANPVY